MPISSHENILVDNHMNAKTIAFVTLAAGSIATSLNAQTDLKLNKPRPQHVIRDSVEVRLGDTLIVTCERVDNVLKGFQLVDSIAGNANSISIRMTYEEFGSGKATLLQIVNPFDGVLRYRANIRPISRTGFIETTIAPAYPKIMSMEMWPYEVTSAILYDFTLSKR